MWIDEYGFRCFTCQDLHDAGVTRYRFPHPPVYASCCPICHGWGNWREHTTGLVLHDLTGESWLICCWTFRASDSWVDKQLQAWRRADSSGGRCA